MTILLAFDNDEAGQKATLAATKKFLESEEWFWALPTSKSEHDRMLFLCHVICANEPNVDTPLFKAASLWIDNELELRNQAKEWERQWKSALDDHCQMCYTSIISNQGSTL